IIEMQNLDDFDTLDLNRINFQKLQHVKEKWTKYFVTSEEITLINKIKSDNRFFRFDECALINVGITTGNNKYFSVTDETCKEYELEDVTLPLIGRSSHLHGIYFTNSDWEINRKSDKRARLVYFPDIPFDEYPEKHKKYIELGEQAEEHKGYKCSIRDRWYIVPSVWVPDAFFLRRNNLYPKFVLNHCNAVSTDTTHRIKFYEGIDPELILLSYYNSISFAFTEICGRSYGGGVLEILPGEVGNVMLPKIQELFSYDKKNVINQIDDIIRNNQDVEKALDIGDELMIELLKIEPEWCKQCREIWKKLQRRRLKRS
ncbi:MAG: class I SAM-dependent methyltransferase, partial [Acutalibacteraceae bacterium]|nr:class I SAM-dependent methyltransferase [Acutalibacteraceae bacterium]